jgi:hypothetical protein
MFATVCYVYVMYGHGIQEISTSTGKYIMDNINFMLSRLTQGKMDNY